MSKRIGSFNEPLNSSHTMTANGEDDDDRRGIGFVILFADRASSDRRARVAQDDRERAALPSGHGVSNDQIERSPATAMYVTLSSSLVPTKPTTGRSWGVWASWIS
jgi:hypothetical protein